MSVILLDYSFLKTRSLQQSNLFFLSFFFFFWKDSGYTTPSSNTVANRDAVDSVVFYEPPSRTGRLRSKSISSYSAQAVSHINRGLQPPAMRNCG